MAGRCELCGVISADNEKEIVEVEFDLPTRGNHGSIDFETEACAGCANTIRKELRELLAEIGSNKIRVYTV